MYRVEVYTTLYCRYTAGFIIFVGFSLRTETIAVYVLVYDRKKKNYSIRFGLGCLSRPKYDTNRVPIFILIPYEFI